MKWKRYPYRRDLQQLARKLRKNMTYAEILLWQEIRRSKFGVRFHRQIPIKNFIVDFLCRELELVIEVDGSSHNDPTVLERDQMKQQELESLSITVIRFKNEDVLYHRPRVLSELDEVIEYLRG
ncbi:MAG: endonuclease domain-containing protein [Bacteroidota bacterium]